MVEKNDIFLAQNHDLLYILKYCTNTNFYLKSKIENCCMFSNDKLIIWRTAEIAGRDLPIGKQYTQSHARCKLPALPHVTHMFLMGRVEKFNSGV